MARNFLKGMDISFTDEIEAGGGSYFENGEQRDILDILQRSGVNSIRLRIWNDPAGGYCNLERTLAMAKRIKSRGLHFLLDFHYSDRWADPANQWKPKAWEDLNFDGLLEAVRGYTHEVLSALAEQGTLPDMVQVGNEITPGMLWDDGKVDGEYDTDDQWEKLTDLVKAGVSAVRAVDPGIELMIHIDRGGDWPSTLKFLERFERHEVDFDVIGQSFYPWWHGTLRDLRDNLTASADRFGKPIIVVETAYPWTLDQTQGIPSSWDRKINCMRVTPQPSKDRPLIYGISRSSSRTLPTGSASAFIGGSRHGYPPKSNGPSGIPTIGQTSRCSTSKATNCTR